MMQETKLLFVEAFLTYFEHVEIAFLDCVASSDNFLQTPNDTK